MKCLFDFLIICLIIEVTFAALAQIPPNADRKEGQCLETKSYNIGSLKYEEEKLLKDCIKATCNKDGSITLISCGSVGLPNKNCKLVGDESKHYPECCPKPVCP